MGTFLSFVQKKKCFSKNGQYFPTDKKNEGKKTKNVASLLASKKDTRWTGNRCFFKGGLRLESKSYCYCTVFKLISGV